MENSAKLTYYDGFHISDKTVKDVDDNNVTNFTLPKSNSNTKYSEIIIWVNGKPITITNNKKHSAVIVGNQEPVYITIDKDVA